MSGAEPSGVDLARVALRTALEAARRNGGTTRTPKPKLRTTPAVGRDGREPMRLGAAIGALVTERAWELPTAGATLRERWEAIAPELAGHVVAVGYDPDSGQLTVRPESSAWATKTRLEQNRIVAAANASAGRTVVRGLRILAPAPCPRSPRMMSPHRPHPIVCEANAAGGTMSCDERRDFVRGDKRQIQTAVLGGADSEEPLMLPLEAIELDAFRRRHEHDTFWCGLLLGGCGLQLTTKLYTDRVCHFAHHPGPDGHPHLCGRHARGVSSADHLYVKSAAAAWLRSRNQHADFEFVQPDGVPIGSVVDIRFPRGGLRVHLDQAVEPSWDQDEHEPVLGVSVPVDRDTLIDRRYVHRIRLESEGTARRVRIGTEAFARETEWFALDECEMTERGLSTPAVERVIRARSTPPPSRWPASRAKKLPDAQARAQALMRRLADARRFGSVVAVNRVCADMAALTGTDQETQAQLAAAVEDANCWLEGQAEVRRDLFARLEEAVTARKLKQVRQLLVRVNATAGHDRTGTETAIADEAASYLTSFAREQQTQAAAQRKARNGSWAGHERVRRVLGNLRRRDPGVMTAEMRGLVEVLVQAADEAGNRVTAGQAAEIASWRERAGLSEPAPAGPMAEARAAAAQRTRNKQDPVEPSKPKRPLHEQVARRFWIKRNCPRCHAPATKNCVADDETGTSVLRKVPHDERVQLIIDERKARQRQVPRWGTL